MRFAYLYAGQGSQHENMGEDLYQEFPKFRDVIDRASDVFRAEHPGGKDLRELMFRSSVMELSETRNTQPALAAFAAGVTAILSENRIRPEYAAGLSLGEYSALYAAGVFDLTSLIRVTGFRGTAMQLAGQGTRTKMCAILGGDEKMVSQVCEEVCREGAGYVTISNYNTPAQNVISGDEAAVERAKQLAEERGARRCLDLKVSGAFHTEFMQPAADALADYLLTLPAGRMKVPVIFNVTGLPLEESRIPETEEVHLSSERNAYSGAEGKLRDLLVLQVTHGVRMSQTIQYLKDHGIDTIVEIGPGKVLSGFVRKTVEGVKVYSIDSAQDLRDTLSALS